MLLHRILLALTKRQKLSSRLGGDEIPAFAEDKESKIEGASMPAFASSFISLISIVLLKFK